MATTAMTIAIEIDISLASANLASLALASLSLASLILISLKLVSAACCGSTVQLRQEGFPSPYLSPNNHELCRGGVAEI